MEDPEASTTHNLDRPRTKDNPTAGTTAASPIEREMRFGWLILLLALWLVTCFMGSATSFVTRNAYFTTMDGRPIERCGNLGLGSNPREWCDSLTLESLGQLPEDQVQVHSSSVILSGETIGHAFGETLVRPDMWLAAGLGGTAIIAFWVFARATGTLRAGIAAGVVLVFFGLLLLPTTVTFGVPGDLRGELIWAWGLVIGFYFTTEAVIQGLKIRTDRDTSIKGDLASGEKSSSPAPDG